MFEQEYTVRYSEVASNSDASLHAIISYFQDTTMFHSASVGQGLKTLSDDGMAWLLASWHIKINSYPKYLQKIRARTWATKFSGIYGYRDFEIVDENDNVLAIANSIWFLYNTREQKIQRVTPEIASIYKPEERYVFSEAETKLRAPKEYNDLYKTVVSERELDTNNHVNNVNYINFALDALPQDFEVKELKISYKKAAVLGNEIYTGLFKDENAYICVLHDKDGAVYAVLEFR